MIPHPPSSTLFPYTTLFRSQQAQAQIEQAKAALRQAEEKASIRPGQAFDPNKVPEVANARVALELAEKNLRPPGPRSEEHTSELQSQSNLVCRLLLEKKKEK